MKACLRSAQTFFARLQHFAILLVALLLSLGSSAASGEVPPVSPAPDAALLPSSVRFIENVGQFDPRVRFQLQGGMGTLWLTENSLWLSQVESPRIEAVESSDAWLQAEPRRTVNVKLSFAGANPHPHLEAFNQQETVVHYYHGNDPAAWHTHVPVWGGVRYRELYPGVDLVVGLNVGQPQMPSSLPWRLELREGADLSVVRLRVEGAEDVTLAVDHLRLRTALGDLAIPLLALAGEPPASHPAAVRRSAEAFEIAAPFAAAVRRDAAATQTAYPETAYFGSYLGGSGYDWLYDMTLSGEGDILDQGPDSRALWVAGWTASSDFPAGPGLALGGLSDAFVTKLQRGGVQVAPIFSAYIGGSDEDAARAIAAGADGSIYVAGWTRSSDFAVTGNPYDATHNGCMDAFVLNMDDEGNLRYASYLGGSHVTIPGLGDQCGDDYVAAIAVDSRGLEQSAGIVYVTGATYSQNFPTTSGAYDTEFSYFDVGLNWDTFVAKLDLSKGTDGLLYSTFVGGGTPSWGADIAIDGSGDVYVVGRAQGGPDGRNFFPTTPGAYDRTSLGTDAFFFKLHPGGHGADDFRYATFLGVDWEPEYASSIALDSANHAYVCGGTYAPDFPTTPGAFDRTCGSDGACNMRTDFFVSKLDPAGNGAADLLYSTFLGGDLWEGFRGGCDIALGKNGDVYVTGDTSSTEGFPITADAYAMDGDPSWGDAFVVRLRPQGKGAADLIYGTYVGGSYGEGGGTAIALDDQDRVYVAGETVSSDFPITEHALYNYLSGERDVFIFRLLAPPPGPDLSTSTKTVAPDGVVIGELVTYTVRLVNSGTLSATATLTDTLPLVLLLQGRPTASAGAPPAVDNQTITWGGVVDADEIVTITYTAQITVTGSNTLVTLAPPIVNRAYIADGTGNVYLRRAFVNAYRVFLPLILK